MSYADIPGFMAPEFEDFYRVMAERLPNDAKVVEVGVAYGRSIAFLAEALHAKGKRATIFAVDTWSDFMGCERDDWIGNAARAARASFANPRDACAAMLRMSSPIAVGMTTPVHMASVVASDFLIGRGPFDLVFIDANHTFEAVGDDIIAWSPTVKRGGILAGDDYDVDMFPGLVRAVDVMVKPRAVGTFATRGRVWMHEVK